MPIRKKYYGLQLILLNVWERQQSWRILNYWWSLCSRTDNVIHTWSFPSFWEWPGYAWFFISYIGGDHIYFLLTGLNSSQGIGNHCSPPWLPELIAATQVINNLISNTWKINQLSSMLALTIRLASLMLTVRYLATLETLIINSTLQSSRGNI